MMAEETAKEFAQRLIEIIGPPVRHTEGSGAVFEFSPAGASTEFWGYGNAVAYTGCIIEILNLIDPNIVSEQIPQRAVSYHGGRENPRTFQEAVDEIYGK